MISGQKATFATPEHVTLLFLVLILLLKKNGDAKGVVSNT